MKAIFKKELLMKDVDNLTEETMKEKGFDWVDEFDGVEVHKCIDEKRYCAFCGWGFKYFFEPEWVEEVED